MILLLLACAGSDGPFDSPTGAVDSVLQAPTLVQGGVQSCEQPELRTTLGPLEDVTPWTMQPAPQQVDWQAFRGVGAGVGVADLDGDGALDLYLPGEPDDALWMATGDGSWVDESALRLPSQRRGQGESVAIADIDADGDPDLYIGRHGADQLLLNEGGVLIEAGPEAGADGSLDYTTGVTFGDRDGDGDLDLFLAQHSSQPLSDTYLAEGAEVPPGDPNDLRDNQGDGVFVSTSMNLPVSASTGYSYAATWIDANADGLQDLYVVNDLGPTYAPNALLLGQDGELVEAEGVGADLALYGMGLGVGDINQDGLPDFAISSWGNMALLESDGAGGWVRSGPSRGLSMPASGGQVSWGLELADMNNDGREDLLMAFGWLALPPEQQANIEADYGLINPILQPDALYLQDAEGKLHEVGAEWGFDDPGATRGLAVVDLDGDGWLDLVRRDLYGTGTVLRARCGAESWLSVSLKQSGGNPDAVGARVRVLADGVWRTDWLRAGGHSLASSVPAVAHFGLGDAEEVEGMEVLWPDGRLDWFEGIEPRQQLQVVRP